MPTQPFRATPFESIEKLGKKAARPVKQAAELTARDVRQSLGLEGVKELTIEEKGQIEKRDRDRGVMIRQNLARINQEVAAARKGRQEKQSERMEQIKPTERSKRIEQKKKESVLAKMLKTRTGTKEAMQRASG